MRRRLPDGEMFEQDRVLGIVGALPDHQIEQGLPQSSVERRSGLAGGSVRRREAQVLYDTRVQERRRRRAAADARDAGDAALLMQVRQRRAEIAGGHGYDLDAGVPR